MSIYKGYRRPLSDVHVPELAIDRSAERETARTLPIHAPLYLRRSKPCLQLLAPTARWIAALPEGVRPTELSGRFARIANQIHATWNDPPECRRYFESLFSDHRGPRQGIPVEVLRDIEGLRAYHVETYPPGQGNAWMRVMFNEDERA